jgi:hypothetical protein
MRKKEKKKESGEISRREFLKDAGLVVGGAAIGSTVLLAACEGETETTTVTAPGATSTVTKTVTVTGATDEVTVLTPFGHKPPVQNKPLTPRPVSRLEDYNKVYLLDITFSGSYELAAVMADWIRENRPNVNLEVTTEPGSYNVVDETILFQQIKDNWPSCAIVIGGH